LVNVADELANCATEIR